MLQCWLLGSSDPVHATDLKGIAHLSPTQCRRREFRRLVELDGVSVDCERHVESAIELV